MPAQFAIQNSCSDHSIEGCASQQHATGRAAPDISWVCSRKQFCTPIWGSNWHARPAAAIQHVLDFVVLSAKAQDGRYADQALECIAQ